ncbi:unnamed protein product [Caenorhabditis angaria]|uniref:Uncharacterized protein n=1 Tax=Caenorhabditis angaria TaxID=860376 RepID=A0A9P1IG68_9PELO|nr:unnamed protein product [Caenorhabditis angaria]
MSSGYSSTLNSSLASSALDLCEEEKEDLSESSRKRSKNKKLKKRAKVIVAISEEEEIESSIGEEKEDEKEEEELEAEDKNDEKRMCGLSDLVTSCLSSSKSSIIPSSSSSSISRNDPLILSDPNETPTSSTSASSASQSNILCGKNKEKKNTNPFLKSSQFSGVEPTIRFYTKGTKVTKPARKIVNRLTWCHNSLLPVVMRHTLAASHFTIVDESMFYIGYWGRHLKSIQYKNRLWMHIKKQQDRFGDEFDIMPFTYLLPNDRQELLDYLDEDPARHIIIKPPASARGTGIQVTRKQRDFPATSSLVAQHYIERPLTINKAKFDLRLYAYVPSLEPLRVYLYDQGLVRFASVPYSSSVSTISNKYMHLTNYSINKLAEQDGVANKPVPKWTLTHLWEYFEKKGIDSTIIRKNIEDVIIKAFISCEKPIRDHIVKYLEHGFICYELFGIDILLDENLKPWLLEVNISPSLHSGTPLDVSVKAPLAKDVLNIAGIHVPPHYNDLEDADYSTRPRNGSKSREQMIKEASWVAAYQEQLGEMDERILKRLTPEDVRMLVEFEDELTRIGDFKLVYPTVNTLHYQRFFAEPLYANLMLQQWQLQQEEDRKVGINRLEILCRQGYMQSDYKN